MESRILRVMPIILSHAPPICEEWGELNVQVQLFFERYLFTTSSLTLEEIPKSLHAKIHSQVRMDLLDWLMDHQEPSQDISKTKTVHGLFDLEMHGPDV